MNSNQIILLTLVNIHDGILFTKRQDTRGTEVAPTLVPFNHSLTHEAQQISQLRSAMICDYTNGEGKILWSI